ncbi:hypothetical protein NGF19_25860 [Streptomyces sp. RY43-2]|uniref:Secreted protein n=1 Tax=Streptomyces macrolidinus TaxID=2952607 RepID=A0ABT0ZKP8_9ACTN|nr:hypothetical protein [Streptomyces macrolidinus]MCN9244165.1 hypothetical protein [Streptomyces macrolidinus]
MNESSHRRVGRILGAGLLAVAVVGGVGFTAVRVEGADRDAGKPVWKFPATAKGDHGEREAKDPSGLRALLRPYDFKEYGPGPDIGEFGSEAVLNGREATALMKQGVRDMPLRVRRKLEEAIDKQHIQGMAMRSYAPVDVVLGASQAFTIDFQLVRMQSPAAARDVSTSRREVAERLGLFSKGPAIKGYEKASCYLMPKELGMKIDRMSCTAYVGDVVVSVNASGPRPLGTEHVAAFIGGQLDRIKDTGKAV